MPHDCRLQPPHSHHRCSMVWRACCGKPAMHVPPLLLQSPALNVPALHMRQVRPPYPGRQPPQSSREVAPAVAEPAMESGQGMHAGRMPPCVPPALQRQACKMCGLQHNPLPQTPPIVIQCPQRLPGTPVFAWPALAAAAATKACGASAVGGAGGTLWRDEAIPGPATQARCRLLCGTAAAAEIARRARHTQRLRAGRCIELHGWEVAVARQANQGHAGRI